MNIKKLIAFNARGLIKPVNHPAGFARRGINHQYVHDSLLSGRNWVSNPEELQEALTAIRKRLME